jgi:hypothetical protein
MATTPVPTQPAAPPVTVQKQNVLWAFIQDHWQIAVVAIVALVLFFVLPHFKELAYGLLRVAVAVFLIALVVYTWTRNTVREYIASGAFVAEFRALEAKHRVAVTVTLLVVIAWVVVECLVHP